jgi:hypothetical protein
MVVRLSRGPNPPASELIPGLAEKKASEAMRICIESIEKTMNYLSIPLPRHVKVSGTYVYSILHNSCTHNSLLVRPGNFEPDVSDLVTTTREIVQTGLKNDAWVMWTIAQRASIPLKIEASVE